MGNHGRMNEWNDIAVLTPPGDIDIATVPALRRRLDALIGRGVRRVVINCQAVSFIDSTGLAFLLTRARELMRREGLLSLVNASGEVVRFLEIARLVDILHVAGPARESIPAIPVGELPRWSKSVEVRQGIENLPYYRHRIAELLESLPLRRDERYDVALASGEALGNAYDHAGGVGCILTVQAYGDRVVLEVLDRGAGYSIDGASEPVASEERGRGIKLMRMLVDNVEVARRTDGAGTRVRMVKLFSSALESCA